MQLLRYATRLMRDCSRMEDLLHDTFLRFCITGQWK